MAGQHSGRLTISELQAWVAEDWKKRSKHQPSLELQLLYIIEELGEVAEAIRKTSGAKDRKETEVDLGSEIADLLIALTTIANHFDVDIEKEVAAFQARLAQRQAAGY